MSCGAHTEDGDTTQLPNAASSSLVPSLTETVKHQLNEAPGPEGEAVLSGTHSALTESHIIRSWEG